MRVVDDLGMLGRVTDSSNGARIGLWSVAVARFNFVAFLCCNMYGMTADHERVDDVEEFAWQVHEICTTSIVAPTTYCVSFGEISSQRWYSRFSLPLEPPVGHREDNRG